MSKKVDLEDRFVAVSSPIIVRGETPRERDVNMLTSQLTSLRLKYGKEFAPLLTECHEAANVIAQQQETRVAENKAKAAELKKAHNAADFQFPIKFSKNLTECLMYLKSVPVEELQKLYHSINGNPQHFASVLDYRVPEALQMLETELLLRAALRPAEKPSHLVQTVKEILHINSEGKLEDNKGQ